MSTVLQSQTCTVPALEEDLAARTIIMLYRGGKKKKKHSIVLKGKELMV